LEAVLGWPLKGNSADNEGGDISKTSGKLTLTRSAVLNNNSGSRGGGIFAFGIVTLVECNVAGTSAFINGGGISNQGSMSLTDTSVAGNSAFDGAGVFSNIALTVTNCTLSGNTARGDAGGLFVVGAATLINTTIAGNTSGFRGGGIANHGTLTLINSTAASNSSRFFAGGIQSDGTLRLSNTIVAGNVRVTALGATPDDITRNGGVLAPAGANNLIGIGGSGGLINGVQGKCDLFRRRRRNSSCGEPRRNSVGEYASRRSHPIRPYDTGPESARIRSLGRGLVIVECPARQSGRDLRRPRVNRLGMPKRSSGARPENRTGP